MQLDAQDIRIYTPPVYYYVHIMTTAILIVPDDPSCCNYMYDLRPLTFFGVLTQIQLIYAMCHI